MPQPPTPPGGRPERLGHVLADVGAFVWEADAATLEFTTVSRGVESVLGIAADDWPKDPAGWAELLHPDDRRGAVGRLVGAASSGTAFDHEHRMRRADGTYAWVREIGRSIPGPDGRPMTIVGLTVEVTGSHAAESERIAHDERFRSVIERIPALVYHRDAHGRGEPMDLPYVSVQVSGLLGLDPHDWVGDPEAWRAAIHPDDVRAFEAAWNASRAEPAAFSTEYRLVGPSGAVLWFRDEAVPMLDERGRVSRWQGVMLDVTTERETHAALMEAEERYRALVEESPMITYLDAVEGPASTIYISPQTTEVLGYTPEEWYEDPDLWSRIVHPEDAARPEPSAGEGPASSEYRLIAKDGREVWVHDRARLITDEQGRPRYWQGVLIDVTEQREAERLRHELERERTEAERLRTEDELKTTFLHAVSHDLRTPLAAILGLAVTLGREDVQLSSKETHDLAERIGSSARRLDRIVRDFLDLERLQRGAAEPDLHDVDLAEVVRDAATGADLGGRRLSLELDPTPLRADPAMVERIVENLLGNAAKHTPEDAQVWVRVAPTEAGAMLVVEDDGPGVPRGARQRIFEPFLQGPGAGPGSGVGLALVARFAELHGGRAWVEDRAGGGASFRVTFLADGNDAGGAATDLSAEADEEDQRDGADSSADANQA